MVTILLVPLQAGKTEYPAYTMVYTMLLLVILWRKHEIPTDLVAMIYMGGGKRAPAA